MRSQAKSLEFVGKSVGERNSTKCLDESSRTRRRNLETLFNGAAAKSIGSRKEPSSKVAFSLVLDLEANCLSRDTCSQSSVGALKTFLFTHAPLVESHLRVLRGVIQSAV